MTERTAYAYSADPSVPAFPDDKPIVIFDGYCGLCSRIAQFVLRHDRQGIYRLLPAQTVLGTSLYRHFGLDAESYETFIVLKDGRGLVASDAGLELFRGLGFPWSLLWLTRIVPRALRDAIYFWIARNRMRFFGRTASCYLPDTQHRDRFIAAQIETEKT